MPRARHVGLLSAARDPDAPGKASNGLCSPLIPTRAAVHGVRAMVVGATGEVEAHQFFRPSCSHARFTHTEVAVILANTCGIEADRRRDLCRTC